MLTSALSERTMSAFMLSIGTSLSFESSFPSHDKEKEEKNAISFGELANKH